VNKEEREQECKERSLVAALAYACLSRFIPKYLNKLFLKDNSPIIQGQHFFLNFFFLQCKRYLLP
jgi:hypothetical protein